MQETKVNKDGKKQLAPDKAVFTHFEQRLEEHTSLLNDIFESWLGELKKALPDFEETSF